jgi:Zinc binding domain
MSNCCSANSKPRTAPAVIPCPVNGARSKQVDILTVRSLVRRLPLQMPAIQYYYCEARGCDVVYFRLGSARADLSSRRPVGTCWRQRGFRPGSGLLLLRFHASRPFGRNPGDREIDSGRADHGGSEGRKLRLRGEESFGEMLLG